MSQQQALPQDIQDALQHLPPGIQDALRHLPPNAQVNPQELVALNGALNGRSRMTVEQFARIRRIIVGLLATGLAIEAINYVFPGAIGLFVINMVNTGWHMASTGTAALASAAQEQVQETGSFMLRNLIQLAVASMGTACDIYSGLKQYVSMSSVGWMLSFMVGGATLRGANDIHQFGSAFVNGQMDVQSIDQIERVKDGLESTGSTAAQWASGFEEAMRSMTAKPVKEGLFDRQEFLDATDASLTEALYDALHEDMTAAGVRMPAGEVIDVLWSLQNSAPDRFNSLSPKIKFLFSVLHGIRSVSEQRIGSYSVPGTPERNALNSVEPAPPRPDERMAPLYASVPPEVEGRFPEYGTRVRPRCRPLTEAEIDESIVTTANMVSGRPFNPDNSEAYDLITKNGFLQVVMMEPLHLSRSGRQIRSGNIFTAFTRLPVPVQENIIRGMYNELPQDVDIQRALTDENIKEWAKRFRKEIMLSSDTSRSAASARTREDRSSDSDRSDKETSSKANKQTAYSRGIPKNMPPQAFRSATSAISAANAPYPSDSNEDERGGRRTHRRRNNRRRVTRKGRKGKKGRRQTKRKKGQKGRKGRNKTKRR